jgi:hypothetical protein
MFKCGFMPSAKFGGNMPRKQLVPQEQRVVRGKLKQNKQKHKAKSWATLNTNAKFEIIGDDLIARGIVQA